MKNYLDCLEYVYKNGLDKGDRTGTGTKSVFGYQMRFDLRKGFPAVTTKKLFFKGVVHELIWMLKGETNIEYLTENGVKIWNEWATEDGDLGPVYGAQWRRWKSYEKVETNSFLPIPFSIFRESTPVDQIQLVIDDLKTKPDSRRHIVSAWNPEVLPDTSVSPDENAAQGKQALPPCHAFFQFYSAERPDGKRELSCQLYQRSADLFLGVPFNIASYSLLTHMIAHVTDHEVGEFIHTLGDAHIYSNHFEQVEEQLSRQPLPLPQIWLNPKISSIDNFTFNDIKLENYKYHSAIKAPISI